MDVAQDKNLNLILKIYMISGVIVKKHDFFGLSVRNPKDFVESLFNAIKMGRGSAFSIDCLVCQLENEGYNNLYRV